MDPKEPLDVQVANRLATAAPGSVTLAGETYLVGQPTKAEFITLRKELIRLWKASNSTPLTSIAPELQGLPPELQKIAVEAAVKLKAGNQEPDAAALQSMLFEPEAAAFWAWLLIRKNHPDVKLAAIKAAITRDTVDDVLASLLDANGLRDADPNSPGGSGS